MVGIGEGTGGGESDVCTLESHEAVRSKPDFPYSSEWVWVKHARPLWYLCTGTSVYFGLTGGASQSFPALYSYSGTRVICGTDTGEAAAR